MKPASIAAAVTLAWAACPALAANTLITFEGVASYASVADYYAGGTDSDGNAGTNLGVSFSDAALALSNDVLGTYFSNAPTPGTVMFAQDGSALMNVASGFVGELSFAYSATVSAFDAVNVYSGLDGQGTLLGSISLDANAQADGCSDSAYCDWQSISLSFGGVARSVTFGGDAGDVAFDDIAITAIPEPATGALLALGLAAVAFGVRRQRQGRR